MPEPAPNTPEEDEGEGLPIVDEGPTIDEEVLTDADDVPSGDEAGP